MSSNFFRVKTGLTLKPLTTTVTGITSMGDADVTSDGKLNFHDGSSAKRVMMIDEATNIINSSDIKIGNIEITGNTISSIDTDGNVVIDPNGTGKIVVSSDIDVPTAGDLAIGASVGANNLDLGGASTSVRILGNLEIVGQTIEQSVATDFYGSKLGGGDMRLGSTTSPTKGFIILGDAGNTNYDETNDRLGIGVSLPVYRLEVDGDVRVTGANTIKMGGTEGVADADVSMSRTAADTLTLASGDTFVADAINPGNLQLSGNTVASSNTDGDVILDPNGTGKIKVAADIDVQSAGAFSIGASVGANDITIGSSSSRLFVPGSMGVDGSIEMKQIATPASAASGKNKIYAKADGFFYTLNSSGVEVQIGAGSGGTSFTNFATNGNFGLNSTAGYTASAGTFDVTNVAGTAFSGYSGCWTPSAAADTLGNTPVVITSGGGPSGNGAVTMMYKTASALHTLQVVDGSTVIASLLLPASASGYSPATLNFIYPATSTGLNFRILAGDTTQICIDEAFIGDARAVNLSSVSQTSFLGSITWAQTANCNWQRTGAFADYSADSECPTPTVTGAVSAPATKVPNVVVANAAPGNYMVVVSGGFGKSGTGQAAKFRISDGINTDGDSIFYTASSNGLYGGGSIVGNFTRTTSGTVTFSIQGYGDASVTADIDTQPTGAPLQIKIYRFPLSSQIAVTPDLTPGSWSGYHGADCALARTNATLGDPTADASCTFTERTNNNFGIVTSYLSGSDKLAGFVFTPKKIGRYFVRANIQAYIGTGTNNATFDLSDTAGTPVVVDNTNMTAKDNGERFSVSLAGIYSVTSIAPITLRVRSAAATGAVTINGPNSSIEWSIFYLDNALPSPILQNQVSTKLSSGMNIEMVRLETTCTAGTCALTYSTPGISSVTWISAGGYDINFVPGTFSGVPICTGNVDAVGSVIESVVTSGGGNTTANKRRIYTVPTYTGLGSTPANAPFELVCTGPR